MTNPYSMDSMRSKYTGWCSQHVMGTSSDMILYYIAQYTRTAQTCRFTRKCIIPYNEFFEKKLNIHNLFIPLYLYYIIIMLKRNLKKHCVLEWITYEYQAEMNKYVSTFESHLFK